MPPANSLTGAYPAAFDMRGRVMNGSDRSAYYGMTGEEAGRAYLRRVRMARALFGGVAALLLVFAFACVIWGNGIFVRYGTGLRLRPWLQ